jgi:hypothetical protein
MRGHRGEEERELRRVRVVRLAEEPVVRDVPDDIEDARHSSAFVVHRITLKTDFMTPTNRQYHRNAALQLLQHLHFHL